MAITRSQIARQLLQSGGPPGGGDPGMKYDAGTANRESRRSDQYESPGMSPGQSMAQFGHIGHAGKTENKAFKDQYQGIDTPKGSDRFMGQPPEDTLDFLSDQGVPTSNLPGGLGVGLNLISPARNLTLRKNIDYFKELKSRGKLTDYPETVEGYQNYMKKRLAGEIDAAGNPLGGSDDNDQPIIPLQTDFINQATKLPVSGNEDVTELVKFAEEEPFERALAFRADGGRVGAMGGGIMNADMIGGMMDGNMDEMGRQMYGLGKLVKKATRAVKKIAKSPIGKAALLYTGAGALSNLAAGSGLAGMFTGFTSPKTFLAKQGLKNIFTRGGLKNIFLGQAAGTAAGPFPYLQKGVPKATSGLLGFGGELSFGKVATLASVLPLFGLGTGQESEEEAKKLIDNSGISAEEIEQARNSILQAAKENYAGDIRARGFKADGGLMRLGYQEGGDAEPVAKKTMPLLDMDGMEKDYRETGGFVDMGRMERADDVPARLSKNEFVFTADAVRNAGEGDIDKGAEVMYNMMKNLEAGGEVSEESQGLEGARRMFQTSQRLEEVL